MSQVSWILLALTVAVTGILWCLLKFTGRRMTWNECTALFGNTASTVTSTYALTYVIFFIGFHAAGITVNFPNDDAAITVALLLGSAYSVYGSFPKLLKLREKPKIVKKKS